MKQMRISQSFAASVEARDERNEAGQAYRVAAWTSNKTENRREEALPCQSFSAAADVSPGRHHDHALRASRR